MGFPNNIPKIDNGGFTWKYVNGTMAVKRIGYPAWFRMAPGYLYSTTLTGGVLLDATLIFI